MGLEEHRLLSPRLELLHTGGDPFSLGRDLHLVAHAVALARRRYEQEGDARSLRLWLTALEAAVASGLPRSEYDAHVDVLQAVAAPDEETLAQKERLLLELTGEP